MPLEHLIYDRTSADVRNATLKGQYNASDLNRVESWCEYLKNELNTMGYSISFTTKTNWVQSDPRRDSEMERIRQNILKLMTGFRWITKIYTYSNTINYSRANNYEKILNEIYNMMLGTNELYILGGIATGGEPLIWQNRFIRTFDYPEIT